LRSIRVTFSIADLNNIDLESDYEDRALGDEEGEESEDTNINGGRNRNFKATPEDSVENAIEDAKDQESFPARICTTVEKPGKGALVIEAVAQDGMITINEARYYPDALDKTAQISHEQRDMYTGPHFSNLDEDLQLLFEKYLDERGIDTALALFVPDYIDMKEQKEYMRWLSTMKDFIDA
jgi:complement component 1 Q subcomponent-binding protein